MIAVADALSRKQYAGSLLDDARREMELEPPLSGKAEEVERRASGSGIEHRAYQDARVEHPSRHDAGDASS